MNTMTYKGPALGFYCSLYIRLICAICVRLIFFFAFFVFFGIQI